MSSPEESTSDPVIKTLCEKSNLLAFVEGQEEYKKSVKRLFNGSLSSKPKAFIKPKTADEVCHVLQYASANQLQVSVLGGGHDPKGRLRSDFPVFPPSKLISATFPALPRTPAARLISLITTNSDWFCAPILIVISQAFPVS